MAASDYAYWNEERGEYGYWVNEGATWVPCDKPVQGGWGDWE